MNPTPENDTLRIERVQNGWIVSPDSRRRQMLGHEPDKAFVATTPEMLADILRQWAAEQQMQPRPLWPGETA